MLLLSITTGQKTVVPFNTMTRADAIRGGGWTITDARGIDFDISDLDWRLALEMTVVSSFPAAPGTNIIWDYVDPAGQQVIQRTTVLGWACCADGNTRPLTLDREQEEGFFVEFPDGRVEDNRGLGRWPTVEAWADEQSASRLERSMGGDF